MITITIDVDEITNVAYQNLSPENKECLKADICLLLQQRISSLRSQRLKKLRDEIAADNGCKGLNAEMLNELLRDED